MQKITPFLWFNGQAEEAAMFYTSVFKDAKMGSIVRNGSGGQAPEGTALTATFQLFGQDFIAMNGGPQFSFTPAVSFVVNCHTQEEIDVYWNQLSIEGTIQQCGWLQDRFGLSWQIVPRKLGTFMTDSDAAKVQRVMRAMMGMTKMDLNALEAAYAGKELDEPAAASPA